MAEAETISEHHLGQTIVKETKARKLKLNSNVVDGEVIKGCEFALRWRDSSII